MSEVGDNLTQRLTRAILSEIFRVLSMMSVPVSTLTTVHIVHRHPIRNGKAEISVAGERGGDLVEYVRYP
jgi:hypothetical protein